MSDDTKSAVRIIRGFSRLGVGAAILVMLCGAGLTAMVVSDQYAQSKGKGHISVAGPGGVTVKFPTGTDWPTIYKVLGSQASVQSAEYPTVSPTDEATRIAVIGLGITAAMALAAWGFFRGVGWMLAGFARD
jgi:hypothetical protein